jgi:hypothetical protein
LLVFLLLHGLRILLILLDDLIGNHAFVFLELVGQLLKVMVGVLYLLPDVAVPVPQLEFADEVGELLVQLDCLLEVFLVDLLSQMFVQFALLDDFLVDLGFGFGAVGVRGLRSLLLVETREVQVFVGFEELVVFNVLVEVHIVEFLEVADIFAPVGQSSGQGLPIVDECEFGGALGDLDELVGLLGLHEPLLGIAHLLDLLLLGLGHLVGEAVEH